MRPLILFLLLNCSVLAQLPPAKTTVVSHPDFKTFFDKQGVAGSFLLFDQKNNRYATYNYERCQKGFLPASTFKIINTLIGLETGVIPDSSYGMKWDGTKRFAEAWNRDHTLASAFRVSAVWYYQELARRVGVERMKAMVQKARYGKMDITPTTLDNFWLAGNSRISQQEQVDFMRRVVQGNVPFSKRNLGILKGIMLLDSKPTYKIYGKTGWASHSIGAGKEPAPPGWKEIGWFVGYVETANNVYYFATNVEHTDPVPTTWIPARRAITEDILRKLGIIP